MKVTDYRDMYYAISNGIEIGLSIDSVLEEVVAEREPNILEPIVLGNIIVSKSIGSERAVPK